MKIVEVSVLYFFEKIFDLFVYGVELCDKYRDFLMMGRIIFLLGWKISIKKNRIKIEGERKRRK